MIQNFMFGEWEYNLEEKYSAKDSSIYTKLSNFTAKYTHLRTKNVNREYNIPRACIA